MTTGLLLDRILTDSRLTVKDGVSVHSPEQINWMRTLSNMFDKPTPNAFLCYCDIDRIIIRRE